MKNVYTDLDMNGSYVTNAPNLVTSENENQKILSITRAEYEALKNTNTLDNDTFYMISDEETPSIYNMQLGDFTVPNFPFTPNADGILIVRVKSTAADQGYYLMYEATPSNVTVLTYTAAGAEENTLTTPIRKGLTYPAPSSSVEVKSCRFYPFTKTMASMEVDSMMNANSDNPVANSAVSPYISQLLADVPKKLNKAIEVYIPASSDMKVTYQTLMNIVGKGFYLVITTNMYSMYSNVNLSLCSILDKNNIFMQEICHNEIVLTNDTANKVIKLNRTTVCYMQFILLCK